MILLLHQHAERSITRIKPPKPVILKMRLARRSVITAKRAAEGGVITQVKGDKALFTKRDYNLETTKCLQTKEKNK